jgi:hypothetical protein
MTSARASRVRRACEGCGSREMAERRYQRALCSECVGLVRFEERLAALHGLEIEHVTSVDGHLVTAHRPEKDSNLSPREWHEVMLKIAVGPDEIADQFLTALKTLHTSISYGDDISTVAHGRAFLRLGAKYLAVFSRRESASYVEAVASVHAILGEKNPALRSLQRVSSMVDVIDLYTEIEDEILFRSSLGNFVEASTMLLGRKLLRALALVELERLSVDDFRLFVKAVERANRLVNAPILSAARTI